MIYSKGDVFKYNQKYYLFVRYGKMHEDKEPRIVLIDADGEYAEIKDDDCVLIGKTEGLK